MLKIAAVIVTYNRLNKLKKALNSYESQSVKPQYLIVVNNASTDSTHEYLEKWRQEKSGIVKIVLNLEENLGGSGGFYYGEQKALELSVDWIMIADDDAYPEPNYIEGLVNYIDSSNREYSIVCGRVEEDGNCENVHRRFLKSKWSRQFYRSVPKSHYKEKFIYPDFVSYVGILLNVKFLKRVGLVRKDFFIWNDDVEHSYRLSKVAPIVCLPDYLIIHDAEKSNFELSWKDYYGYRNNVCIFKKHFTLQMPFVVGLALIKALLCSLKGKSISEARLRVTAIMDGLMGHMGKHPIYKPGWKP